jgi:DNA-binding transcriptional ArsR family regulator
MPDHSSSPVHSSEIVLPRVLGALSDPTRLGIVRVLADGAECGWGQLRAPLSHHLKVLREAGVTQTRQEGTRRRFPLREGSSPSAMERSRAARATAGAPRASPSGCRPV